MVEIECKTGIPCLYTPTVARIKMNDCGVEQLNDAHTHVFKTLTPRSRQPLIRTENARVVL